MKVRLRKMSLQEFETFREYSTNAYAKDLMQGQNISLESALEQAKTEFSDMFPEGIKTKDNSFRGRFAPFLNLSHPSKLLSVLSIFVKEPQYEFPVIFTKWNLIIHEQLSSLRYNLFPFHRIKPLFLNIRIINTNSSLLP